MYDGDEGGDIAGTYFASLMGSTPARLYTFKRPRWSGVFCSSFHCRWASSRVLGSRCCWRLLTFCWLAYRLYFSSEFPSSSNISSWRADIRLEFLNINTHILQPSIKRHITALQVHLQLLNEPDISVFSRVPLIVLVCSRALVPRKGLGRWPWGV